MAETSRGKLSQEIKHDIQQQREMHCNDTVLHLAG